MINIAFTRPFYKPRPGGVGTYIRLLLKNLNYQKFCVYLDVKSDSIDAIPKERSQFEILLFRFSLLLYLFKYPFILKKHKIDIVHSNPSMLFRPLLRESIFIFISYLLKIKILIFIHGWNLGHVERIKNNFFLRNFFIWIFNKANLIIVLAHEFKDILKNMGINTAIIVETTMMDDNLLNGFSSKKITKRNLPSNPIQLLFLSRVEESKGIFRTIDAFEILREKHNNLTLNVAGEGPDLSEAKNYVLNKKLENIKFLGYVDKEFKKNVFVNSNIFILPTTHGEGLPIAILEAISYGLPVVTRPVGGIKNFFENEKHGFLTESTSPSEIAVLVDKLISDESLRLKISEFNYDYGEKRFLASAATKRIEKIYIKIFSE